jgi:hypothetical protein
VVDRRPKSPPNGKGELQKSILARSSLSVAVQGLARQRSDGLIENACLFAPSTDGAETVGVRQLRGRATPWRRIQKRARARHRGGVWGEIRMLRVDDLKER